MPGLCALAGAPREAEDPGAQFLAQLHLRRDREVVKATALPLV